MNMRVGGVVCVGTIMLCCAAAQSNSDAGWVGVWQGELDGQPSVILTLAEDTGTLEGTLVLNIITREGGQPHIVARQPPQAAVIGNVGFGLGHIDRRIPVQHRISLSSFPRKRESIHPPARRPEMDSRFRGNDCKYN